MARYGRRTIRQHADRFDRYVEMAARYDSMAYCGHEIKRDDIIGYNPSLRRTRCTACWAKWVDENLEADRIEADNARLMEAGLSF